MKTRFVLFLAVALLATTPAVAQSTWESRTRTGEYAFAVGDVERAEQEFQAALAIAQKLPPPDPRLEASLANLARLYEYDGRFEQALPMYQLLVAAGEARLGADGPDLLPPLLAVARVAMQMGDVPTAEEYLLRYRTLAESSGAADPDEHWRALAMLARMCTLQGRHDEALELQREAVAVLDRAAAPTDLDRAEALESLAQMELLHGDPRTAEGLLLRAAELRADSEDGGVAAMLAAAAATAFGAGELDVAEDLAERGLAAARAEVTDTLPAEMVLADVSWARVRRGTDVLGDLYLGASPGPELEEAHQRLLAVHGAVYRGTDYELARENLSHLAQVAALQGQVQNSSHWQRLYIDLQRGLTGADSPEVVAAQENLIGLFRAAGQTDDALVANAWLMATEEQAWGADNPRLLPTLRRQLELLTEAGLKKDARALAKRIKKLEKTTEG